ncbi:MAG: MBL fold metallo-hydrolase [Pseudomonadota bacterium]
MRVKFYLCTCGYCYHPEWSCMKGATFKSAEFPAHFGIIVHPVHGLMLFDTGYASHLQEATHKYPYCTYSRLFPFQIPHGQDVASQLKQLGYTNSDVKWIFISHFHPDHIAGLKDFPASSFICSRFAWETLHQRRGWSALKEAFLTDLLPDNMMERISWIEDMSEFHLQNTLPGFSKGKDLFGCGSLLAIPLSGHAVGQYGLYIPETYNKPVFMIADACWRSESYQHFILPPSVTMALMYDPNSYRKTLLNLHRLSLVRDDIIIVPSHCNKVMHNFSHSML